MDADARSTEPLAVPVPAPPSLVGRRLSHYEILAEIGRGGMGVVYRALDTRLEREVAIKVLPPHLFADPDRRARFIREAKAAASLDHPHIAAVHDIEQVDDVWFIVLELVQGEKLADLLRRQRLSLPQSCRVAAEVAEALACAHEHGVVHRDIKPGNVIIGPQGHATIIDFGLAKLFRPDGDEVPQAGSGTETGHPMGTVAYMSPEQARGEHVDHRTDLFSLGVMLYELASGLHPFDRGSPADTLAAIVRDTPPGLPPLDGVPDEVQSALRRLIARCLEKRPDDRYQRASELAADLRNLHFQLESGPRLADGRVLTRASWTRLRAAVLAAAVVGVVLVAWIASRMQEGWADTSSAVALAPSVSGWAPRQLTSGPGWDRSPAISPDGTLVAYVSDVSGNPDIWVIDVRGGEPIRLTSGPGVDGEPAWFPDGSRLAFESTLDGTTAVWSVPRLGGPATRWLNDARHPTVAPDGRRIGFVRASVGGFRIGVASLDAPAEARQVTGEQDGLWAHTGPAWAPGGDRICYAAARGLWIADLRTGRTSVLTKDERDVDPAWSPDGRFVYFTSEREGTMAIWRVDVETGRVERQTTGTGGEQHPSVSGDGSRLAYATFREDLDTAIVDLSTGERHRIDLGRAEWMPTLAPDGSAVAFVSDRPDGQYRLWIQPLSAWRPTGTPRQITSQEGAANHPSYSPDGQYVAYYLTTDDGSHQGSGRRDIWAVPTDGGAPQLVVDTGSLDYHPAWSSDGARIAFISEKNGTHVWTVPVAGGRAVGPAVQVSTGATDDQDPAWSPDGTRLAYIGVDEQGSSDVWIVAADGRSPPRRLTSGGSASRVAFDPATGAILASGPWDDRGISLRRIDPASGATEPLSPEIRLGTLAHHIDFSVSADGRTLAYAESTRAGDLWVLEARPGRITR